MTIGGKTVEQLAAERERAMRAGPTIVGQIHETLEGVRRAHRGWNDDIERRAPMLSQDGLRSELAAFARTDEAKSVDACEQAMAHRMALAQAEIDAVKARLTGPTDTAGELRNDRAWSRTRHALDTANNGANRINTARMALQQARPDEVGVLAREIPEYLKSAGLPTDWIEKEVASRVPELARKQADLAKLHQAQAITNHSIAALRRGFASGTPPSQPLVNPARFDPDR
jgi:hypothetical protein